MSDNSLNYPVMPHIQEKTTQLVNNYMKQHSKVLVTRVDIRYPTDHGPAHGNRDIVKTMAKVNQTLSRGGYDPSYIWVREQKQSDHPHYHCLILLNGQKTRSPGMVFDVIERHWQNTIHTDSKGLIDHCNGTLENPHENGKVINRSNGVPDYVNRQINYISKPDGKGLAKDGMRDFGMSRLPSQTSK